MAKKGIKNILYNKLFSKKIVDIDRPGFIVSKTSTKYTNRRSRKRILYYFEEIIAQIQKDTLEKYGKKKTNELWYRIGKEAAIRYFLLEGSKKEKEIRPEMLSEVLVYMCNVFYSGGLGAAESIEYVNQSLELKGSNCLFCRKGGIPFYNLGFLSGVVSEQSGMQAEGEMICQECPKKCHLSINSSSAEKKKGKEYVPGNEKLSVMKEYEKINFIYRKEKVPKALSFRHCIRFNKVVIGKQNRLTLQGKSLYPTESGILELIRTHYEAIHMEAFFDERVIRYSKKIAQEMLQKVDKARKLKSILDICMILGWGVPLSQRKGNKLMVWFLFPPISKYGARMRALTVNGFINSATGKAWKLEKVSLDKKTPSMSFEYAQ